MDFSGYYDNDQKQDYVKKYVYSNCVSLFMLMLLSCFFIFFLVFYKSYQSHFLFRRPPGSTLIIVFIFLGYAGVTNKIMKYEVNHKKQL